MLFDVHSHHFTTKNDVIFNSSGFGTIENGFFSVGIHPWEAENFNVYSSTIERMINSSNCLAVGEIGLDKLKGPAISIQTEVFKSQVKLAEQVGLPVIIHCVKAWNELKMIRIEMKVKQPWIFHGFSKSSILEDVLSSGLMISIGVAVLHQSKLQNAITKIPMERLFLETDDAAIDIFDIYKKVSEIKQIPLSVLEKSIEENVKRTFRKWQSG